MIAQSMQYTPAMTSAAHGLPLSAKKNRINAFVFRVRVVSLKEDRPSVRNAGTACLLLSWHPTDRTNLLVQLPLRNHGVSHIKAGHSSWKGHCLETFERVARLSSSRVQTARDPSSVVAQRQWDHLRFALDHFQTKPPLAPIRAFLDVSDATSATKGSALMAPSVFTWKVAIWISIERSSARPLQY